MATPTQTTPDRSEQWLRNRAETAVVRFVGNEYEGLGADLDSFVNYVKLTQPGLSVADTYSAAVSYHIDAIERHHTAIENSRTNSQAKQQPEESLQAQQDFGISY